MADAFEAFNKVSTKTPAYEVLDRQGAFLFSDWNYVRNCLGVRFSEIPGMKKARGNKKQRETMAGEVR